MRKIFLTIVFLFFVQIVSAELLINILRPQNNSTITSSSTILRVLTNENANCNYSLCRFIEYSGGGAGGGCSAPKQMARTGASHHAQLITNLTNTINNQQQKEWYRIDVTCENSNGSNKNSSVFYVAIAETN